jgi:hypothetical protein
MLSAGSVAAQTVIRQMQGAGVIDHTVVLPAGRLNQVAATALASEFLDRYGSENRILILTMGEDELEVRACLYHYYEPIGSEGRGETETLVRFLKNVRSMGPPKRPLARVLSIHGNALLSYRDSSGLSERVIRGTHDPTRLRVASIDYQLVFVSLGIASAAVAERDRYSVTFYARASPRISLSSSVALLRRLRPLVSTDHFSAMIRPDAWFVEIPSYPLIPVFTKDLSVPNAGEYYLAPSVNCGHHRRFGVRCNGRNFQP